MAHLSRPSERRRARTLGLVAGAAALALSLGAAGQAHADGLDLASTTITDGPVLTAAEREPTASILSYGPTSTTARTLVDYCEEYPELCAPQPVPLPGWPPHPPMPHPEDLPQLAFTPGG